MNSKKEKRWNDKYITKRKNKSPKETTKEESEVKFEIMNEDTIEKRKIKKVLVLRNEPLRDTKRSIK